MELSLIEYLESKNFDAEQICVLQKKFMMLSVDEEKMIKKIESIYKVFEFAELPDIVINDLLINNISLLKMQGNEILEIAYVWFQNGLLSDAASKKKGLCINNNLRTYLRALYLNSGIQQLRSPISYYSMRADDADFARDHYGYIDNDTSKSIEPFFENLVSYFGKGNNYEEKLEYLQTLVRVKALKWYLNCLEKERQAKKANEGYGSI